MSFPPSSLSRAEHCIASAHIDPPTHIAYCVLYTGAEREEGKEEQLTSNFGFLSLLPPSTKRPEGGREGGKGGDEWEEGRDIFGFGGGGGTHKGRRKRGGRKEENLLCACWAAALGGFFRFLPPTPRGLGAKESPYANTHTHTHTEGERKRKRKMVDCL